MFNAGDRGKLNAAHGVPSNLRDASESVWKQPATRIPIPSNPPRTERAGSGASLFSKANLGSSNTSFGNKTASQTLVGMRIGPPRKRQKVESLHFEYGQGTPNAQISDFRPAIINVDEDEVVHTVTETPDRLDLLSTPASAKEIRKHKAAPPRLMLNHDDDEVQIISSSQHASGSRILLDGDATRALEGETIMESDPIVEYSSPAPSHVKQIVADFESRSLTKDKSPIKKLDLRAVNAKAPVRAPIKRNMKGKNAANGKEESLSTDISPPVVRPQKSSIKLPLAKAYIGVELKEGSSKYYISWRDKRLEFWDENGEMLWLNPPSEVSSFHFSEDPPYVVKIITRQAHSGYDKRNSSYLQLGDKYSRGHIVLWFDNVGKKDYMAFIAWLRAMAPGPHVLRGLAGHNMWKMADDAAIMAAQTAARQTTEEMPNKGPLKRPMPPEDEHDTTPPPVSELLQSASSRSKPVSPSSRPSRNTTRSNSEAVRRSARTQRSPATDPEEMILCYPQGVPGAVYIKNSDYRRLEPGEYLNDTLIEFGLKLWLNKLQESNPNLANEIHVFSSFFYKKLNNKNADEGYDSIRKWTSKIDIFSKKYIIVPINEHLHWYLVIIYQPEHVLLPPPPPLISSSPATRSQKKKSKVEVISEFTHLTTDEPLSTIGKPPSIDLSRPTSPSPSKASSILSDPHDDIDAFQSNDVEDEQRVTAGLLSLDSSDLAEIETIELAAPIQATSSADNNSSDSRMDEIISLPDSPMVIIDDPSISTTPTEVDFDMDRPLSPTISDYTKERHVKEFIEVHDVHSQDPATLPEDKEDPMSTSIEPGEFYGKSSKAFGKQKAIPNTVAAQKDVDRSAPLLEREDDGEDEDDGDPPTSTSEGENTTYIFTFDSLGSKHPQAIRNLARYLKKEAEDKLNKTDTSTAVGKLAHVPYQPNFCDCGLFLLHFAETFMTDPVRYSRMIKERTKAKDKQTRHDDWKGELTGDMRERLREDIDRLSAEWKKDRAAKEEAKRMEESTGRPTVEVIVSSDDDVDIVETRLPTPAPGQTTSKRGGKRKTVADSAPAMRLR